MALTRKDKQGAWMITAALASLVALVAFAMSVGGQPKPDAEGCVGTPTVSTVIVLDQSEGMPEQTRAEIVARALAHVGKRAAVNERVTVFSVTALSKQSLMPAFNRCKPPREGSRATQDVDALAKRYQETFIEPLSAALALRPGHGKESPLAQAMIDVSLSRYLRGERNTLLVFSDLLEHTPKFSLYGCTDSDRAIAAFRASRQGTQERPVFRNTEVALHVIPRQGTPKLTLRCRDQLWNWFFGDNAGPVAGVALSYLPGL